MLILANFITFRTKRHFLHEVEVTIVIDRFLVAVRERK